MKKALSNSIKQTAKYMLNISEDIRILNALEKSVNICVSSLNSGKKILLAGNGGSAADAQHIAAELVSKFNLNRPGLCAIALTTDTSIITSIGNDYGFDFLFSRQLEAIAGPGDVFIAYSTSGRSLNILRALNFANENKIFTIGLTGNGNSPMKDLCKILIKIPSDRTPLIQECHLVLGHLLCEHIEINMFGLK